MIKKNIKYYKRGNSFTSNISITKKDIRSLKVRFNEPENSTNKSKESIEQYFILTPEEYDKLTIHQNQTKTDNKELEELKQTNDQLKTDLEETNNKYNLTVKELETIKPLVEKQQEKISDLQDKQVKEIKEYSQKIIKSNDLLNIYKFLVYAYEKNIKEFNNMSFFKKIFNHNIKIQDKNSLKDFKKIEYIPKTEKE
jgi:hypothetical protein